MADPKRTSGLGIRNWLTLLLILTLLPLVALQGYQYYNHYQEKQEEALQANLEIARSVAKSFESFVQDVLHQELAIGLAITSPAKMTPDGIIRLLKTSSDYPAVRDFNWADAKGRVIYSSNPAMVGADASDRSYFREVADGREWAVGELIIGKVSGKPTIGISRGIRDDKGNLLGVVFAAILPEKLDAHLAVERSKGGAISLVDRQGMLVYRYPAIETTWEERDWLRIYPEYAEVFKGKEISRTFYATYEGKERLASIVPMSSIGWAAGAGKRKEDVTGPVTQSLVRDAVLFLSVSFIAFLVASALAQRVTNPVHALRAYASALGDGKVPGKIESHKVVEVQELEESFDVMAERVRTREAALQESDVRLRIAQRYGGVGVWTWNVLTGNLIWEPELEELYGLPPGSIHSYEDWTRRVHPADLPRVEAELDAALHRQLPFHLEFRICHASGDERWILARGRGEYDGSGQLIRVSGVNLDITELKHAEQRIGNLNAEIQAQMEEMKTLLEILPTGIWIGNADCSQIVGNPAGYRMMDFPIGVNVSVTNLSTEVPAGIRMFIDGEEITTEDAPMRQAARTGEPHYNFEYEALFPDGRRKTVLASVVPMLDTGGTVRKVIGVYTDITERKHAETALRESEQRLRLAQQAARVGAFEWNLQNDRNVWTPELEALYGLQPGEFAQTGTAWAELIHPEDRANMTQLAQQSSHTGELTTGEWRVVWPDGSVHWLAGRWQVFKDASGQPLKMTGVNVDITDLKQAEEALRKANESLEQKVQERTMDLQILTAQLEKSRHELRKLASELVISEERERKRVAGVLHDDIAQTLAAARMRLDLLLSIASDQKDKQTLQEVKTFLVQSIRETRALMNDLGNPLLFDLGVKSACESLAKRLMEGHPTRIICDIRDEYKHLDPDMKAMLFQVVRELLNNVVKHSQAENAHVLVDTENGQFRVKVTDDGVGFDSKMLGVPSGEGGFGLYSVRERLTAMDGSLDIESTPGAGTAVTATLPAALD